MIAQRALSPYCPAMNSVNKKAKFESCGSEAECIVIHANPGCKEDTRYYGLF